MKVLIVDDNVAILTSLKMILKGFVDEIVTLDDPSGIPPVILQGDVDAVILDMNFNAAALDGKEGLMWLSKIKEIPEAPAVVVITAFGDVALAVEAMKEGADDFITKPWDNQELIEKLSKAVEKNKEERKQRQMLTDAATMAELHESRRRMSLEEVKYEHALQAVRNSGGNISAAAKQLGINRQTLYNILKR